MTPAATVTGVGIDAAAPASLPRAVEAVSGAVAKSSSLSPSVPTAFWPALMSEPAPLVAPPSSCIPLPAIVSAGPAAAAAVAMPMSCDCPSSPMSAKASMASVAASSAPDTASRPFSMCGSRDSTKGPALSTTSSSESAKRS